MATNPTPTNPFGTTASAFSPATTGPVTGYEQTLSSWGAPYITDMLAKTQALTSSPYQTYQGPLTAGTSALQQQAFQGIGGLQPTAALGQATATMGEVAGAVPAYQPVGGSFTDTGVAQQYMNPYMQQVLAPQMQQMQRQADIQRGMIGAQAAKTGAFGGAREGLMNQQLNAELMRQQQQATGQAYGTAYQQAQAQYNQEQQRRAQEAQFGATFGLQGLAQRLAAAQALQGAGQAGLATQLGAGAQQRAIEQEGVAADLAEFEKQRMYPYQQLQFQQAMLQGMPISAVNYGYQEPSGFSQLMTGAGGLEALYNRLFGGQNP